MGDRCCLVLSLSQFNGGFFFNPFLHLQRGKQCLLLILIMSVCLLCKNSLTMYGLNYKINSQLFALRECEQYKKMNIVFRESLEVSERGAKGGHDFDF